MPSKYRTVLFALLLTLNLGGCIVSGGGAELLVRQGADLNDSALLDAEFIICRSASKGAVDRRYGQTEQTAAAYTAFCALTDQSKVAPGGAR